MTTIVLKTFNGNFPGFNVMNDRAAAIVYGFSDVMSSAAVRRMNWNRGGQPTRSLRLQVGRQRQHDVELFDNFGHGVVDGNVPIRAHRRMADARIASNSGTAVSK